MSRHARAARVLEILAFALLLVGVVALAGQASTTAQILAAVSIAVVGWHAAVGLGTRDAVAFLGIVAALSFAIENIGVATGYPFGSYHFVVGAELPHIGRIPLIVGLLYFGMGYPAWIIAGLLLGAPQDRPRDLYDLTARPIVASFVMVQWDAVMDPSNATIGGLWIWHEGGAFFGVPLSNFVGWFLTVWTMFFVFGAYCLGTRARASGRKSRGFWLVPILLYLTAALCVLPPALQHSTFDVVRDGAGLSWRIHDIRQSAVVVSMVTMVATSILACLRLWAQTRGRPIS